MPLGLQQWHMGSTLFGTLGLTNSIRGLTVHRRNMPWLLRI
jgi:hypothetical protein